MRLETHEGFCADPAEAGDVVRAVAGLTQVGEAFVILSDVAETYIQAAGTIDEQFIVECRHGGAGNHYRADRRVSADELVAVLTGYLRREPEWRGDLTWHRVRVDKDPPSA